MSVHRNIFAVLIGINDYKGQQKNLSGCLNDVETMKEFLAERLGVPNSRINTLTSPPQHSEQLPPTRKNVEALIRHAAQKAEATGPNSLLFVHYSGHGARIRSRYPKLQKGTYDEALCTLDEVWRDVEVSRTLEELTKNGLAILVVLDCCHSGGADRADDSVGVVRSADCKEETNFEDEHHATDLLDDNSGLPDDGGGRNAVMKESWFYANRNHNLIAACQPHELARERFIEDSPKRQGVLTYFLRKSLDTLYRSSSPVTYETLMDHITGLCAGTPTQPGTRQQPMHLGNRHRLLFGTGSAAGSTQFLQATVERIKSVNGHKYVVLDKGEAHGVGMGDEFRLYAPEKIVFGSLTSEAQDAVEIRVERVEGTKSMAKITLDTKSQAAAGWFSVRTKRGAAPIVALNPNLYNGLLETLWDDEWNRVVSEAQGPRFDLRFFSEPEITPTITVASGDNGLEFLDSEKQMMDYIPPLKLSEGDSPTKVRYLMDYLFPHLSSYQALVDLHPTANSTEKPNFDFNVVREETDNLLQGIDADQDVENNELMGPSYKVIFQNKSTLPLYVSVFNLGQAYGVNQQIPSGGASSLSVDPGEAIAPASTCMVVPELLKTEARKPNFRMRDIFKVLVTTRQTDFGRYGQADMIDWNTWKRNQIGHPARNTLSPQYLNNDFWVQSISVFTTPKDIVFPDRDDPSGGSETMAGNEGDNDLNVSDGQGETSGGGDAVNPCADKPHTVEMERSTVLDHRPSGWESE